VGLPKYREVNRLLIVASPVKGGEGEVWSVRVCEERGKKLRA